MQVVDSTPPCNQKKQEGEQKGSLILATSGGGTGNGANAKKCKVNPQSKCSIKAGWDLKFPEER